MERLCRLICLKVASHSCCKGFLRMWRMALIDSCVSVECTKVTCVRYLRRSSGRIEMDSGEFSWWTEIEQWIDMKSKSVPGDGRLSSGVGPGIIAGIVHFMKLRHWWESWRSLKYVSWFLVWKGLLYCFVFDIAKSCNCVCYDNPSAKRLARPATFHPMYPQTVSVSSSNRFLGRETNV
jgi:hypothetical protein